MFPALPGIPLGCLPGAEGPLGFLRQHKQSASWNAGSGNSLGEQPAEEHLGHHPVGPREAAVGVDEDPYIKTVFP